MKSLKVLIAIFAFALLLGSAHVANAQCAQCAATVETNNRSGAMTTKGINNGILFLLAAPYLAVSVVGYIWYKKYRRKKCEPKNAQRETAFKLTTKARN